MLILQFENPQIFSKKHGKHRREDVLKSSVSVCFLSLLKVCHSKPESNYQSKLKISAQ